jgi:hypothetical protein
LPFLGILYLVAAIFFGVHVVRTGRNMAWLLLLFFFPLLGSAVYFFAVYLPELRHSSVARQSARAVSSLIDPNRAVREAQMAFDRTPTVDNRSRLAEALLARGDHEAAIEHYAACASGPYAKDAKFRRGLARAQLAAGHPAEAAATLKSLFEEQPLEARGEAALWLAQAFAEGGDQSAAIAAFDRACETHNTTETLAAYGIYLARIGRAGQARAMLERVLHNAHVGTESSRRLNRDAIDQARDALRALDARGDGVGEPY